DTPTAKVRRLSKIAAGEWTFDITTRDRTQTFSYIVEAKSAESTEAIEAKTEWKSGGKQSILGDNKEPQKVYASVKQGSSPVLNGSVSAKISRPNATDLEVELKDDGVGADSFASDGIYTANFVGFTKAGRYSVQATIEGDENTATNTEAIIGIGGSEENKSGLKSTGKFIRSALGQTFQVVSYVPVFHSSNELICYLAFGKPTETKYMYNEYEPIGLWDAWKERLNSGPVSCAILSFDLKMPASNHVSTAKLLLIFLLINILLITEVSSSCQCIGYYEPLIINVQASQLTASGSHNNANLQPWCSKSSE
ncbi:hypothetical protein CAPTEDRAFT_201347, partial [Capitella teleta]